MVTALSPRLDSSVCSCACVIEYLFRNPGNPVRRIPGNPVSRITSRMSVIFVPGKVPHRFNDTAHLTFLLAGTWL